MTGDIIHHIPGKGSFITIVIVIVIFILILLIPILILTYLLLLLLFTTYHRCTRKTRAVILGMSMYDCPPKN